MNLIKNSFLDAQRVLNDFIADERNMKLVCEAGDMLVEMFRRGGKVFSCGNGGSLCDAMHFAEELTRTFSFRPCGFTCNCVSRSFSYELCLQ